MDLVTVLEFLLLNDFGVTTEVSFRFRMRGAWFVGETAQDRTELFNFLGKLYETRSGLVHRGVITHTNFTFRGKDIVSVLQLADEAEKICEAIVRKLLERGAMMSSQEWAALVLGR